MKNKREALVSVVLLLIFAHSLPAQSIEAITGVEPGRPEPVNLDIAPQVEPDPEQILEVELARQAFYQPAAFHAWLLDIEPDRRAAEAVAAFALLHPSAFERAHPKSTELIRAEAAASHAILNPHFPVPAGPN
jgi:hypothetical protein